MTPLQKIRAYCKEEVRRQGRGPKQVPGMVKAWRDAVEILDGRRPVYYPDIEAWGRMVEPVANKDGYRSVGVRVGMHVAPPPQEVPRLMIRFIEWLPDMEPDDAYLEFERIHPFRDGNGRVGKIIYNLKRGTLLDPQWPPNFWGIGNP